MKMARMIDTVLQKFKIGGVYVYLTKEDDKLIDKAMQELSKMSCSGSFGVIKNSYVDTLANISFFCGAAVAVVGITATRRVINIIKHDNVEEPKTEE